MEEGARQSHTLQCTVGGCPHSPGVDPLSARLHLQICFSTPEYPRVVFWVPKIRRGLPGRRGTGLARSPSWHTRSQQELWDDLEGSSRPGDPPFTSPHPGKGDVANTQMQMSKPVTGRGTRLRARVMGSWPDPSSAGGAAGGQPAATAPMGSPATLHTDGHDHPGCGALGATERSCRKAPCRNCSRNWEAQVSAQQTALEGLCPLRAWTPPPALLRARANLVLFLPHLLGLEPMPGLGQEP